MPLLLLALGCRPDPAPTPPASTIGRPTASTGHTGASTPPPPTPTGHTGLGSPTGDTGAPACVPVAGRATTLVPSAFPVGSRVPLGADADTPSWPSLPVSRTDGGGPLLFSDSPETVPGPGLLYADVLDGPGRVYVYHATGGASPLRYVVLATGTGTPATVTVTADAISGPWNDYAWVGRQGALRWLQDRATPAAPWTVSVPAAGTVVLDPALDAVATRPGWLMHAIHDFFTDAPVLLEVVAVAEGADAIAARPGLSLLPRDVHDRGTFTPSERTLAGCADAALGGVRLRLGGGTADDPWPAGVDAPTGDPEELIGAYGLAYTVDLTLSGSGPVSVLLAPRGGPAAGAAWVSAGVAPEAVFDFPTDGDVVEVGEAALLGTWDPSVTPRAVVRWTPAGSSSLPVDLLVVPD